MNKEKVTKQDLLDNGMTEEVIQAFINCYNEDDLHLCEEAYNGHFDSDEDFAREMAEEMCDMPKDMHWPYYCIDWKWAARELMMDYSDDNGYYFRNL